MKNTLERRALYSALKNINKIINNNDTVVTLQFCSTYLSIRTSFNDNVLELKVPILGGDEFVFTCRFLDLFTYVGITTYDSIDVLLRENRSIVVKGQDLGEGYIFKSLNEDCVVLPSVTEICSMNVSSKSALNVLNKAIFCVDTANNKEEFNCLRLFKGSLSGVSVTKGFVCDVKDLSVDASCCATISSLESLVKLLKSYKEDLSISLVRKNMENKDSFLDALIEDDDVFKLDDNCDYILVSSTYYNLYLKTVSREILNMEQVLDGVDANSKFSLDIDLLKDIYKKYKHVGLGDKDTFLILEPGVNDGFVNYTIVAKNSFVDREKLEKFASLLGSFRKTTFNAKDLKLIIDNSNSPNKTLDVDVNYKENVFVFTVGPMKILISYPKDLTINS